MKYKGNVSWSVPPEGTPYQRAKQEWDHRMGDSLVRARNWRFVAIITLFLLSASVAGLVYGYTQRQIVPYYIEVYPNGEALARGVAQGSYGEVSDLMIRYQLGSFLECLRTISSDQEVIKQNWLKAYRMMSSSTANMLDEYMQNKETNPFHRSLSERVQVSIQSMLPISESSWDIEWLEITRDIHGNIIDQSNWKGVFHVEFLENGGIELLEHNPIGMYVVDFTWTKLKE